MNVVALLPIIDYFCKNIANEHIGKPDAITMKTRILIFMCLFGTIAATAQVAPVALSDTASLSLPVNAENNLSRKQFNLYYGHCSFSVAIPVAVAGLALMPVDHHVRDKVLTGMPGFQAKFDDYMQYAPWAAHLTMGLCGVKGVSKNRYQIVTADAFAAIMMAAVVNGLKYSINRTRPNGHNASFPSGHTATAFTGATLLAHEYGCRSIWIPIAGYTAATATGVMRVLNNRHYVSDVIVGAAVGILTAELAYWATDAIFKDCKLYRSNRGAIRENIINNY